MKLSFDHHLSPRLIGVLADIFALYRGTDGDLVESIAIHNASA